MKIGSFDTDRKVLLVAEIGNNHEGNAEVAAEMVRRAAQCGVDAVKFQTVRPFDQVARSDTARYERLKRFELSPQQFADLSQLAHSQGLLFLSTPFSLWAAEILEPIVDGYKIASGDNDFYPLLARVARTGKPVVISTGVSDAPQVDATVRFLRDAWTKANIQGDLALLHCVSSYPTPSEQANLRSIPFLAEFFGCTVGYSDHTLGIEASLLAVAAGARIIEKHFTLDQNYSDFRDHQLSADPAEMTELVKQVRRAESMLGVFAKQIQPCETASAPAIRRSIAAARDLKSGHQIAAGDLKWIRPGTGLRPGSEDQLIGATLNRNLREDEPITLADIKRPSDGK